jgi:hypothetical protein
MFINESAVQQVIKSNKILNYLKTKEYNEATLTIFLNQEILNYKQMLGYDFVFVDPFISSKAVGVSFIFGSCMSYYNKVVNRGFELIPSKLNNFVSGKLNQTNFVNVKITDNKSLPDNLPGTKNSTPNEFMASNIPKRKFFYAQYKLHYSFESSQSVVKKITINQI